MTSSAPAGPPAGYRRQMRQRLEDFLDTGVAPLARRGVSARRSDGGCLAQDKSGQV